MVHLLIHKCICLLSTYFVPETLSGAGTIVRTYKFSPTRSLCLKWGVEWGWEDHTIEEMN